MAEFHDISIPVQVRAVRYFGTEAWLVDDGSYINGKAALVEKGWIDEDKIVAAPPEDANDIVPFERARKYK